MMPDFDRNVPDVHWANDCWGLILPLGVLLELVSYQLLLIDISDSRLALILSIVAIILLSCFLHNLLRTRKLVPIWRQSISCERETVDQSTLMMTHLFLPGDTMTCPSAYKWNACASAWTDLDIWSLWSLWSRWFRLQAIQLNENVGRIVVEHCLLEW